MAEKFGRYDMKDNSTLVLGRKVDVATWKKRFEGTMGTLLLGCDWLARRLNRPQARPAFPTIYAN